MKRIFSKLNIVRTLLALMLTTAVLLLIPHADRQSFSYEQNQPWKYPLLTAPFDMPIMRDSTSLTFLRDSVEKHFVPFMKRDDNVAKLSLERLHATLANEISPHDLLTLSSLLSDTYATGIIAPATYSKIHNYTGSKIRMSTADDAPDAYSVIDASAMLSPGKAFERIDSLYTARFHGLTDRGLTAKMSQALNRCLTPNVVLDSATDTKYLKQEYFNVTGAQGIIKKGQRIVDRGEIVTPQIFTNLNTYQEMMQRSSQNVDSETYFYIGQMLYILIAVGLLYLFMSINRSHFFNNLRKMTFLMTFITLFICLTIILFENVSNGIYLVPFAALPVIIMIFFDSRTAIFSLFITVFICALVATFPFQFIFMESLVGVVATFSIHQLSRRSQLVKTAVLSFLTYSVCYFVSVLIEDGDLSKFSWHMIGVFGINSIILSFTYILIVIIERVFGFTSTVTLVELSDINSKLLRRLAEEAPGTFQHSMQVSTLASEAALAIGANVQLVRTGALYHDIGKLESPVFFTENQHGVNPHSGLDPETSAGKIIRHVTYGAQLAAKNKLPQVITDFILQHHGRGTTRYFYNTAVNMSADGNVDMERFCYPGPNPQSSETAVMMMADAVEAASRSLDDFSCQSIDNLVDKIIDQQVADGMFRESPLSFRDLETVKQTFKKRLATIYHSRVAYPEIIRPKPGSNPSATPGDSPTADSEK